MQNIHAVIETTKTMGSIRIIGGQFGGQKIVVPKSHCAIALRPSGDRVRTTLFNWLRHFQVLEHNTQALDLYCGSGVLGIEALSQGIAHVVFVDQSKPVITALQHNVQRLWAEAWIGEGQSKSTCYTRAVGDIIQQWNNDKIPNQGPFDIIFCDPPYKHTDYDTLLIQCQSIIKTGGILYLEAEERLCETTAYSHWHPLRYKKIARTCLHLLQK